MNIIYRANLTRNLTPTEVDTNFKLLEDAVKTLQALVAGGAPSAPTISGLLPLSGAQGSTIVITGTNFTGATQVSINSGAVASFNVDSATQITAVLSGSQATGKVRVTTAGGTATSEASFTVMPSFTQPAPTGLVVDDDKKRISFKRRLLEHTASNYRYQVPGSQQLMQMLDYKQPNENSNFSVGAHNYAAGTVKICEVNPSTGVQISPFALSPAPFTDSLVDAGENVHGNSIEFDAANMLDSNLGPVSNITDYRRTEGQLDGASGGKWSTVVTAVVGRRMADIATQANVNEQCTTQVVNLGNPTLNVLSMGEWINEDEAGTSKEDNYALFVLFFTRMRATNPSIKLVAIGPTNIVRPGWQAKMDYWYARLRVEWPTFADGFVDHSADPYTGAADSHALGLKLGWSRDGLHFNPIGSLQVTGKNNAVILPLQGASVPDDINRATISASVQENTVTLVNHGSRWPIEYGIAPQQMSICPLRYVSDTATTLYWRNTQNPNIFGTLPLSITTGYQAETVAHATAVFAPTFNYASFIAQALINKAIVALKATGYFNALLTCLLPGGGILNFDDKSGNAKAIKLLGYASTPNAETEGLIYYYDPTTHLLDWAQGSGSGVAGFLITLPAPALRDWVLVLDTGYSTAGYQTHVTFNNEEFGVQANGDEIWLTSPGGQLTTHLTGITDGQQFIIVRNQAGVISLRVGTRTAVVATGFTYSGSVASYVLGGGYGNASRSKHRATYLLDGNVPDAIINQFITALT